MHIMMEEVATSSSVRLAILFLAGDTARRKRFVYLSAQDASRTRVGHRGVVYSFWRMVF